MTHMAQDHLVLGAAAGKPAHLAWSGPSCEPGNPCDQCHCPALSAVGPGHTGGLQSSRFPARAEAKSQNRPCTSGYVDTSILEQSNVAIPICTQRPEVRTGHARFDVSMQAYWGASQ